MDGYQVAGLSTYNLTHETYLVEPSSTDIIPLAKEIMIHNIRVGVAKNMDRACWPVHFHNYINIPVHCTERSPGLKGTATLPGGTATTGLRTGRTGLADSSIPRSKFSNGGSSSSSRGCSSSNCRSCSSRSSRGTTNHLGRAAELPPGDEL